MTKLSCSLFCAALLLGALSLPLHAQSYHIAKTVPLVGDGGWDYLTFDSTAHRLFIAHSTQVLVVDAESGSLLGQVPGLNGAHGVALALAEGHGFASSGRDSSVTMFDLKTYKVLKKTTAADDADAILYDPATHRVFSFNGDANSSSVIDPQSGVVIGNIDLGGKPEFGVSAWDGTLFVNLEDKAEIVQIDAKAMTVTRRWPIAPCEEPTGLAIDREHHRLFSGCSNQVMAISDATNGRLITTLPIGKGVDGCAFDPGTNLAFSSNGEGSLTVIHEDSPDSFHVAATVPTKRGARTMTVDPKTHRVFTASADYGATPTATPENPRPRPAIVPGTFVLLVLEP